MTKDEIRIKMLNVMFEIQMNKFNKEKKNELNAEYLHLRKEYAKMATEEAEAKLKSESEHLKK